MRKVLTLLILIFCFAISKSQELVFRVSDIQGNSELLKITKNSFIKVKTQVNNDRYNFGVLHFFDSESDSTNFFIKKNQVGPIRTIFLGNQESYQIFIVSFNNQTGKYRLHNSEVSIYLDLVISYENKSKVDISFCDSLLQSNSQYLTLEIENESYLNYFNSIFSLDSSIVFLSVDPVTISSIETSIFDYLESYENSIMIIDKQKSVIDFYKLNNSLKKTIKCKYIREINDTKYTILADSYFKGAIDKLSFNFEKSNISGFVESSTGLVTSFRNILESSIVNNVKIDLSKYFLDIESPEITLTEPKLTRDLKIVSKSKDLLIRGSITDNNDIVYVSINKQEVPVINGQFEKKISHQGNTATILIQGFDEFGNQTTREFEIQVPEIQVVDTIIKIEENNLDNIGNYFALIITINDYVDKSIPHLDNPIKDGKNLKNTLVQKYTFESNNVIVVENATRKSIFKALSEIKSMVSKNDNFLLFYAGHGFYDKEMNSGYWLPSDSEKDNKADWISFDDVINHIRAITSKHTLVISDACFSGGFLKERSLALSDKAMQDLYQVPSRKVITSGNLTTVPDESVFMKYLVKALNENTNKYLTEENLFDKIKIPVLNNSDTTPLIGILAKTGDEGGNFIFIKR